MMKLEEIRNAQVTNTSEETVFFILI